ncbi:fa4ec345-acf4-4b78-8772-b03dc424e900 [Sclerotinia trifoliorum]|uniref:Fa4ec345-acf4-4b78-8772-b03dc424e900 n=1 Tax=Sclerotinia trifoliorum TaxID=28548 RepID=A0A8H2ZK12_9HELO|nr:fa4ec345-acf4-4b78-8772-b03dc424e900 [Sclerotinia trifoliorum]
MDTSGVWNTQDPTLSVPSQDDFQQFLDLNMHNMAGGLQFDFDFNQQQSQNEQMMHQDGMDSMNTGMAGNHQVRLDGSMHEHMSSMTTSSSHSAILGTPVVHPHTSAERLTHLDAQIQYLQQQKHEQQLRQSQEQQRNFYVQSRMIPPTPNSMEIHGANQHFYSQAEQPPSVFEPYRLREQEMAFTPLVSPAVTPLETHFNIPDYTVPGAYFSPLSSPALHAQNDHQAIFDHRHSGSTNSPIDMNGDSHSAPVSSIIPPRKPPRKSVAPKPRVNTRVVRQSPIVKPNRGRKSISMSAQALGEIIEPSNSQASQYKGTGSTNSAASTDHSESGSISPEHLSDMAPPPLPSSAGRSPYVVAQKDNVKNKWLPIGSPATPASLMRITKSPSAGESSLNREMELDDPALDGFELPEAANTVRPTLPRIDTQSDGQMTPTLSSTGSKTPGFQPLPSPVVGRPGAATSASQSPQIDAMNGTIGAARKTPQTLARSAKKRASTSVLASPALLPKISPSIKPLLPGSSSIHDEATASLLLASKSNYQNILEGTHLPGVSYPSELSTNLTSKRTSHKLAEQGRRNRINSALTTLHDMIPSEYYPRGKTKDSLADKSGSGDAGEPESAGSKNGQSASSKAATVEVAIEYISHLEKVLAEANKRAEEAEQKLVEKEKQ